MASLLMEDRLNNSVLIYSPSLFDMGPSSKFWWNLFVCFTAVSIEHCSNGRGFCSDRTVLFSAWYYEIMNELICSSFLSARIRCDKDYHSFFLLSCWRISSFQHLFLSTRTILPHTRLFQLQVLISMLYASCAALDGWFEAIFVSHKIRILYRSINSHPQVGLLSLERTHLKARPLMLGYAIYFQI